MSLWDLTARELLARTAEGSPTPGGGSVAAICGTLGMGLVVMALEITVQRHDAPEGAAALLARCRTHLNQLEPHPDRDVEAFEGYMTALGLPRSSEAEKVTRRSALRDAARAASEAPLAAARDLLGGLILADEASKLAHRQVVSDVGAGAELLLGGLRATLLNVDVNAGGLPAADSAGFLAARQDLQVRAEAVHASVARHVQASLKG